MFLFLSVANESDTVELGVLYLGAGSYGRLLVPAGLDPVLVLASQGALLIQNALLRNELRAKRDDRGSAFDGLSFGQLIGASSAMQDVFRRIERCAATHAPLLITGEPGTGKTLVAREIHQRSHQAEGRFVKLSCRDLSEDLLLAGLLSQSSDRAEALAGRNSRAVGTIFLHPIDALPSSAQQVLLRILDAHRLRAEAGWAPRVRLIAAIDDALESSIAKGRLPAQFHVGLQNACISLPPLRERGWDLFLLARRLLDQTTNSAGMPVRAFSPEAIRAMKQYPWPGNVRELETKVRQAAMMARGVVLEPEELGLPAAELSAILSLQEARLQFEREYILSVIELYDGHRAKAAQALGIHRSTLYRYLQDGDRPLE